MRITNILLLFLIQITVFGQQPYYTKPFRGNLSQTFSYGSFHEHRFLPGIGISTPSMGRVPVIAVADGYISHISVKTNGLGKAIYIVHDNGSTSFYGHLERFNNEIEEYMHIIQYKNQSFEIEADLNPGLIPVQKSSIIGLSGNSGEVSAPMLFFGLLNTKTGDYLNPLSVGVYLEKSQAPVIKSVAIVPLSESGNVNPAKSYKIFETVLSNEKYILKDNAKIRSEGLSGIAIETEDPQNKGTITQMEMMVNENFWATLKTNRISKNELTKMPGLFLQLENNRIFYHTWTESCNPVNKFEFENKNGVLEIKPGEKYTIKIILKNAAGKASELEFTIEGNQDPGVQTEKPAGKLIKCGVADSFTVPDFEMIFQNNALFRDFYFDYTKEEANKDFASDFHIVKNPVLPLYNQATVRIKTLGMDEKIASKAIIIRKEDQEKTSTLTGIWKDGWMETVTDGSGTFAVQIDLNAPIIEPLSIENNNLLKDANKLQFQITDNLSGIGKFEGTLDGDWALFEYDAKRNLLTHYFDATRFSFNKRHKLKLEVTDKCGNTTVYEATFEK